MRNRLKQFVKEYSDKGYTIETEGLVHYAKKNGQATEVFIEDYREPDDFDVDTNKYDLEDNKGDRDLEDYEESTAVGDLGLDHAIDTSDNEEENKVEYTDIEEWNKKVESTYSKALGTIDLVKNIIQMRNVEQTKFEATIVAEWDNTNQVGWILSKEKQKPRTFKEENPNALQITRLTGDEVNNEFLNSLVYEVIDPNVIEGVYYMIINPQSKEVIITSINDEGTPNQVDLTVLASKIGLESTSDQTEDNALVFNLDESFKDKLIDLMGNHSAIIIKDLEEMSKDGTEADIKWTSSMLGRDSEISNVGDDLANVSIGGFEFDPDPLLPLDSGNGDEDIGDVASGGLGSDFGGGGDFGGDVGGDFDMPDMEEPPEGEEPPPEEEPEGEA